MKSTQRMQRHLLASAIALAFTSALPAHSADGQEATIFNANTVEAGAEFHGFLIKFRDGTAEQRSPQLVQRILQHSTQALNATLRSSAQAPLQLQHERRMSLGADVILPSRQLSRDEAVAAMKQLAALPGVEYVEPNLILKAVLTPNDPSYSAQWGYHDADAGIRANQAWDVNTGSGIRVAVLDTGITNHSDLNSGVSGGYDFITSTTISNDGDGRDANPADPGDWTSGQCGPARNSSWHGTHVAGTVAARTNNALGVAGTAFNASIMPVRVLGTCGGTFADIADAINWSSGGLVSGVPVLPPANVAHVINMSLGGAGACGATMQTAINNAVARGTTVVVAAGNSSADVSGFTPANCNNVISVAAVTSASSRAGFSNYGSLIDVSAPGASILSTLNTGTTTPGSESYAYYDGTSMAAPHVAGTAALVQSRRLALGRSLLSPAQIESLLKNTAYPLSGSCSGGCGAGIVNARAAVDGAQGNSTKINEHTDASGKITVAVFERVASAPSAHFNDFSVEVADDYVVIGGGVEGTNSPAGNLITASYPNSDLSAWLVSSKDHLVSNPVQLKAWAIGLKIAGLSRQQVRDNISVTVASSPNAQHPDVSVSTPTGFVQIGGGIKVNWTGAGNLATATYPVSAQTWRARSKDHQNASPAVTQVYSIGLRSSIAGVGTIVTGTSAATSAFAQHPSASTVLASGLALSGCGALVNWSDAGNLLWKIKPVNTSTQHGCEAASKDHNIASPATITTYAVGIGVN